MYVLGMRRSSASAEAPHFFDLRLRLRIDKCGGDAEVKMYEKLENPQKMGQKRKKLLVLKIFKIVANFKYKYFSVVLTIFKYFNYVFPHLSAFKNKKTGKTREKLVLKNLRLRLRLRGGLHQTSASGSAEVKNLTSVASLVCTVVGLRGGGHLSLEKFLWNFSPPPRNAGCGFYDLTNGQKINISYILYICKFGFINCIY